MLKQIPEIGRVEALRVALAGILGLVDRHLCEGAKVGFCLAVTVDLSIDDVGSQLLMLVLCWRAGRAVALSQALVHAVGR